MSTQFITDENGQKVAAIIPMAAYESLMEDLDDIEVSESRKGEETISLGELKAELTENGI